MAEEDDHNAMQIVDDDPDDKAFWREKDITMEGERVSSSVSFQMHSRQTVISGTSHRYTDR